MDPLTGSFLRLICHFHGSSTSSVLENIMFHYIKKSGQVKLFWHICSEKANVDMFSTRFYKNFIFGPFLRVIHMLLYNKEEKSFIHKLSTFSTFKKVIHILWITCGKLFETLWISTVPWRNPPKLQGFSICRYVYRKFVHKIDKPVPTDMLLPFINVCPQFVHKPTFFLRLSTFLPSLDSFLRKITPKRNIKGFMFLTLSPVPI